MNYHIQKFFALVLTTVLLSSCATTEKEDQPAEVYFSKAMEYMAEGSYLQAIEQLELLNAIHPFSKYNEQALLELTFAYYASDNKENARAIAGRLLRQYPESEQADYALYLRAISYFEDDRGFIQDTLGLSPALRSLVGAQRAFNDFSRIVTVYPDSRFAHDSRKYMLYIRDQLALKELSISEFYLERNANIAALSRAKEVIDNYPNSKHTKRALELMHKAYMTMGLTSEASEIENRLNQYKAETNTPG